ncbi:response regulator [Marinobacterium mangrovicola]|uniref:LuxR family two component transcriptional regulator n=1 Tax=Marinobacterium mangrovicola TaxID=1476959 RepID=A0A4R1GNU9_9GAMM|nr:response regulator transcription factor [Marinobacterium mangrovicola]TCK08963.1 LuxR family two component transcriptional regulator [Marinobacterium mangrovicola]
MKILICDDHAVVRHGYVALLEAVLPGVDMIQAESGREAFRHWQQEEPDLTILDIHLPDISGLEVARLILERQPSARILAFSMYDDTAMVNQVLQLGVTGYITKSSAPQVLIDAVRATLKGKPYVEHELATRIAFGQEGGDRRLRGMTQRELEVFTMMARGLNSREIAAQLNISAKTVANHTALLKQKLGIKSTAELVHLAFQSGLVPRAPI